MHLWHQWQLAAVEHGTGVMIKGDVTAVLYRCRCGAFKTETVNGLWTLEQLVGDKASPTES